MEYFKFKEMLVEMLRRRLTEEYQIGIVNDYEEEQGEFVNIIEKNTGKGAAIRLKELYKKHERGTTVAATAEIIMQVLHRSFEINDGLINMFSNRQAALDHLEVYMERREGNGVYLSEGIYKPHEIGAIVPYLQQRRAEGIYYSRVTERLAKQLGLSKEEIFKRGIENTVERYPMEVRGVWDESLFITLTNQTRSKGAIVIAYPGVLESMGRSIGSDYYVIPSSVDAVTITPKSGIDSVERIEKLHRQMNRKRAPQEILSNHIFEYNREEKKLIKCRTEPERKKER